MLLTLLLLYILRRCAHTSYIFFSHSGFDFGHLIWGWVSCRLLTFWFLLYSSLLPPLSVHYIVWAPKSTTTTHVLRIRRSR
ncbi:hypothetical protein B0H16DRAFT_987549 [Mycena metata]|uniref:Secreted peptide n=1 Tax=Mycena metata TaxID=1033252 RepID=A0AAD7N3C7_9AGAR|nr:hypothetical protein B0H16DRAFT_987549 [Mycena metata]